MHSIDAEAHDCINWDGVKWVVSKNDELPTIDPKRKIWEELSKVYNMPDVPDEAKEIIGNLMLALDDDSLIKQRL